MNFKPIGTWLSIQFRPPQIKTESGLYLGTPIYSQIATVLAVGEAVEDIVAGDTIMMHKHGDGMDVQKSLWYHWLTYIIRDPKKVVDYVIPSVVIPIGDVLGKWDDRVGLIPTKNNVIFREHEEPECVKGIYRVIRHRQNRKPFGDIIRVSDKVTAFKPGQIVLLGKYGGIYFTDADNTEKVLVATSEILGTISKIYKKTKILVSEPREIHDPQAGS